MTPPTSTNGDRWPSTPQLAALTELMLKSGTRTGGMLANVK